MRASRFVSLSSLVLALLVLPAATVAQQYVVMGTPHVNIRTGPGTEYVVVGKAEKGDIFALAGETGDWWEIRMFSGDTRYVSKDVQVYPLDKDQIVPGHNMTLPESAVRRRFIHQSVLMGVDRAGAEADELLPRDVDPARHDNLRRIAEDRILLEMFHVYGLQPAMFDDLLAREGQIGDDV